MATRAVNLEKGPLVLVGELADQVDAVRERPMALGKPVLPEDLADVAVYHYYLTQAGTGLAWTGGVSRQRKGDG